MRVLAVIPARGGSVRVPRKNLAEVGFESLVERAVRQCQASALRYWFEVSTDDIDVALHVQSQTDRVFSRKCGPDGPMSDVLLEVLNSQKHMGYDAVACIQPTSPFRLPEDIDGAIALLEAHPEAQSVVSVNEATGERNGAVYVTRVGMLRDGRVFDEHSLKYPMPAERSLDINTPEDLEEARRIAKEKGW